MVRPENNQTSNTIQRAFRNKHSHIHVHTHIHTHTYVTTNVFKKAMSLKRLGRNVAEDLEVRKGKGK